MNIEEAKKKLLEPQKIPLVEIIRKFKREGIENFVITRPEIVETLLTAYEKEKAEHKKECYNCDEYTARLGELETENRMLKSELEKEKAKNKEAIDFIDERKKTVNKDMAEGTRLQVGTFMWQVDELLEILKGVEEE